MRESGNCRPTDGASPPPLSSLRGKNGRRSDGTNSARRQKLFHYNMPTLHSSSSFWRDGWQGSLRDRQSARVWDFSWSEERKGKGWKMEGRVEIAVLEGKEGVPSLSDIIKCSSVHTSVVCGKCCHLDRTRGGGSGGNNFGAVYHIAKSSSSPSSATQHPRGRGRNRSLQLQQPPMARSARAPRFMAADLFRDFSRH